MNRGILPFVAFAIDPRGRKQRRIPKVALMIFSEHFLGDE
jgi:hypothetical protein